MKKPRKISNIVVIAACAAVIGYFVAAYIFQFIIGVELSPSLTAGWFAFWGTEMAALAAIKTSKVKHHADAGKAADGNVDETEGVE